MDLSCPACGDVGRPHSLVVENRFRLVRCTSCASQYFRPDTTLDEGVSAGQSEYWEQYKFEVYGAPVVQAAFEARYDAVLRAAEAHVAPLRTVLDVGCGIGNFVDYAGRRGLTGVGVDMDAGAVAAAAARGLRVCTNEQLPAQVADESMDALSLWDVVEHLTDPTEALLTPLRALRQGGAVLIETPDGGFPVRAALLLLQRLSRNRINLCGPMYYYEHKIYFTERGLRRMLDRVGVDVMHVRRETSLREKMAAEFEHNSGDGSRLGRSLELAWPVLEGSFRAAGKGNKLLVVGRKR